MVQKVVAKQLQVSSLKLVSNQHRYVLTVRRNVYRSLTYFEFILVGISDFSSLEPDQNQLASMPL